MALPVTSMVLFEWDDETLAPKGAAEHTARVIGSLSEQYQEILASMRFKELLDACQKAEKRMRAYLMRCSRQFYGKQPRSRRAFLHSAGGIPCVCRTYGACDGIWTRAREKNDILLHLPLFWKEIISYQKRICGVPGRSRDRSFY